MKLTNFPHKLLSQEAFTLACFTQKASSQLYKLNIFRFLKRKNLLRKTDQCKSGFTKTPFDAFS